MTEHNSFSYLNSMCRGCLTSSKSVFRLSPSEMKVYTKFMDKAMDTDLTVNLCVFCKWMLLKLTKFSEQCQKADLIMNQVTIGMDEKLANFTMEPKYGRSKTEFNYIGPDEYDIDLVKDDDEGIDGEDDMPLVIFCDDKLNPQIEEPDLKVEVEIEPNKKVKKVKKGVIRDGFTSRMVQETGEYVVIKLTKEQVLEEMLERSKTESYLRAPYKCEKCVKGFNFEDVLDSHNEKHSLERGTYFCEICTQYCPNQVSLRGHIKSHTTRYKCKLCDVIRLSRQHLLEHHAITHTAAATNYSCDTCEFTTNKRTVIQRHVKSHATSERHACDKCGKLFNTRDKLRVHTMRHDKSKRVQCTQCDNNFIYPSLLYKHIQAVHERQDYYCVECDVSFKSPESLRLHFKKAKRHRDASSYKYSCSECSQVFVSVSSRAAHMSAAHDMPKRHVCHVCHKYYSSTDALRAHTWRVHTHRERVCCEYCDKIFTRKSILKVHLRSHDITTAHAQDDIETQKPENLPNTIEIPQNINRET